MLFKMLFNLLKNLRWVLTLVLIAGGLYLAYTQYNAIKSSPLGALLPSIVLPTLPISQTTSTPTPTIATTSKVSIGTAKGTVTYTTENASTPNTQAIGLMYRTSLPQYGGMLFIYETDVQYGFWMKNCEIPLDMLFVNADGNIIDIRENVRPCKELDPEQQTCPSYVPKIPYRYVLEINAGSVKTNGIAQGQHITFQ